MNSRARSGPRRVASATGTRGVRLADGRIAGPHGSIPIRRYRPADPACAPVIVWVHGGAFLWGGLDQPESHAVAAALATAGHEVVTVGYRLTTPPGLHLLPDAVRGGPAVGYPVAQEEVMAVVRHLRAEAAAGAARPVILGGASAGACLSATAALRMESDGEDPLAGMLFAYGLFHARLPAVPPAQRPHAAGLNRITHLPPLVALLTAYYAGSARAAREPLAFPGGHRRGALPPALIIDADRDALRVSGAAFADEVSAGGTHVDYHVLPGTRHGFLNRPRQPGFSPAIELIDRWARDLR